MKPSPELSSKERPVHPVILKLREDKALARQQRWDDWKSSDEHRDFVQRADADASDNRKFWDTSGGTAPPGGG